MLTEITIESAAHFAKVAHGEQKYGNFPYVYHLQKVFETLQRFGCQDENILAAAWLHDVVEDTNVTREQVALFFGKTIEDLVWRVTNAKGVGKNRAERHAVTYKKIVESNDALMLKLADRIANTEESIARNPKLLQMYKKEYKGFREALYIPGVHEKMWKHLDKLMENKNGKGKT